MLRIARAYPSASVLYADLREKWKHEDELINQRVTWLLNSQAFLLSSFGILAKYRVEAEIAAGDLHTILAAPLWWLYGLGELLVAVCAVATTYFLHDGIFAAVRAMGAIKSQLVRLKRSHLVWRRVKVDVLPGITRSGARPAQELARTAFAVWVLAFLYEVHRFASVAYQYFRLS